MKAKKGRSPLIEVQEAFWLSLQHTHTVHQYLAGHVVHVYYTVITVMLSTVI